MPPEALRALLNRQPFMPFRLSLSDGRNLEIRKPSLMMIGGATTIVGIIRDVESEFFDEPVIIANRHIVSADPIVEPALK